MKKIVISLLLTCVAFGSHAQNKYLDSLKTVLAKTTKPIERFDIINNLLVSSNKSFTVVDVTGPCLHCGLIGTVTSPFAEMGCT